MTTIPPSKADSGRHFWLGLGAALLSALGAGLCCAAPLLYLLFGVSFAGLSRLDALDWLQWPLGLLALAILAGLFIRLYLSARPLCAGWASKSIRPFFWLTLIIVLVLLTYPYIVAWLLEMNAGG
ncbi:MAG TPA: hypothetical protein VK058_01770 [Paenalcaligenes sp.]|nr:hypothetical protein [Paenalcaligenes sp.]